jgi:hypothetical protein
VCIIAKPQIRALVISHEIRITQTPGEKTDDARKCAGLGTFPTPDAFLFTVESPPAGRCYL